MADYYAPGSLSIAFYDVMSAVCHRHLDGDVAFYAGLAGPPPRAILEAGVGTGRVAWALAGLGYEVTGFDRSPDMLAAAEHNRPAELAARLAVGDLTSFDFGRRFDLVIAPFYVFNHLHTDDARRTALARLNAHRAEGACIVLHLAGAAVLAADIPEAALTAQRTTVRFDEHDALLQVRIIGREVDRDRQICAQRVEYALLHADGRVLRTSVETLSYAWMTDGQLAALLDATGLRLLDRRSGFSDAEGVEDILVLG
ncbi:MAG TPA: class I SAM-dependent methyltransferase [Azospirillum sp.]|nr:class I SAM-dependent methyltransferase [Azospirillum sp.]